MVKSKRSQALIYGFMIAVVLIILALALAPMVKNRTDNARNLTIEEGGINGLDCSNSSISNFNKTSCIAVDMTQFLFIGIVIFIAGAIITAKIIWT